MSTPQVCAKRGRNALLALIGAFLCLLMGAGVAFGNSGGSVTWAEESGTPATWIFPIVPGTSCTTENVTYFEYSMWRPLYWLGNRQTLEIDQAKSVAQTPSFGNKSVTIHLKNWNWADGTPITSRDLAFTINLLKTKAGAQYCFSSKYVPSSIKSYRIVNKKTIVLHLDRNYNHEWFTWNALSVLVPLPQHAWDKTSANGKVGNYDETARGAASVLNYLNSASKQIGTYTTNPLWKIVDGPWKLTAFTTEGEATFVPNPKYSGSDKAKISTLIELPFTSDTAEYAALLAGEVDVGYVPAVDAKSVAAVAKRGFTVQPQHAWGIGYYIPNLENPAVGAILRQVYIRQALELLVPQQQIIKQVYGGYAYPTQGPVPLQPANPFVSNYEKHYPYTYNPAKAKALLADHGWKRSASGGPALQCVRPGSGANECGKGISSGQSLVFSFTYASSLTTISEEAQVLKSVAAQAGIVFNLVGEPYNTVLAHHCPTDCSWQLLMFDRSGYQGVPTGEQKFELDGPFDAGAYNDPLATALIDKTLFTNDPKAVTKYENYLASQVPWIWAPDPIISIAAVKSTLGGVLPKNVFNLQDPQDWYVK